MGVGHAHAPTATGRHRGRLTAALAITSLVLVVEIVGGVLTGSLALLADAGHMFTDVAGLGMSLLAATLAARPTTDERTFGYLRLEILAAVLNALLLFGAAAVVLVEAVRRMADPPDIDGGAMLAYALVGLLANGVSLLLLHGGHRESLNVRGAYLEVMGDLLGSGAVVVGAVVVALTGALRADPVVSIVVALLILPRTWQLLREAVDVLLEATPRGVDMDEVREHVLATPGVLGVHDLHAWTITSGMPVLSAHIVVDDATLGRGDGGPVLDRLGECLAGHFDIEHCTFQLEPVGHADHERGGHH
ncbi:MAG: cation diffusion facilitator family transporter [Actinomycetes bacterium]